MRFVVACCCSVAALCTFGASAALAATSFVVANAASNSISFFSALPTANPTNTAPTRVIAGAATGLNNPQGIAMSNAGVLYVANANANSVTVYAANASGNATPLRTIAGAATHLATPTAIVLDTARNVFVANRTSSSITEYAAGASGNVAPIATISGAATGLSFPVGLAIDAAGNLFVVNSVAITSVREFAAGATGNVAPIRTDTVDGRPAGLTLDSFDDVYMTRGPQILYLPAPRGAVSGPLQQTTTTPQFGGTSIQVGIALTDAATAVLSSQDTQAVAVVQIGSAGGPIAEQAGSLTGLNRPAGLVVSSPLSIGALTTSIATVIAGLHYAEHTVAYGGFPPLTWSVAAGTLPAGLTLNRVTGEISGTPTTAGTSTVVLRVTDSASTPASATVTRNLNVDPAIQPSVYVANGANGKINAFALSGSGNVSPWTTFGTGNGVNAASGLAFDFQGHLFVANYGGGNVTEYNAGAAGSPIASIGGLTTPAGMAVGSTSIAVAQPPSNTVSQINYDPFTGLPLNGQTNTVGPDTGLSAPLAAVYANGLLWVANYGNDSLTAYRPGTGAAVGDAPPVATISGSLTGLAHPRGIGVDAAGDLLVANQFGASITVYGPNQSGNVAPSRTISGPSTLLNGPAGVDVDTAGRIYVANAFSSTVQVFAANANGNATPVATYSGANTGILGPTALAVTPPMAILTTRLPAGRLHRRYRAILRAAEGTTPYRWSLRHGRLPKGLKLSRPGVISGKPTRTGRSRFTVRLRDSSHPQAQLTKRLTITIRRH